ncbi:LLM class flavin-dependent oxidoreductase [Litorivivens sp.]|uniref:LLM class flavin-dependent oxidoreductase n=1 Tax=Litorivivens sp. TaxID=2020868 RepID=UPI003565E027
MELVMIFDMRAPAFGAPSEALYSAALDMAEWADDAGFDVIGLGEHHRSEDGYNPSPLTLASAMAARTQQIRLRTAVLLASCYDPIRLAEDLAVLQILSQGRVELGLGFGYRPAEFAMFGRELKDRFDFTIETANTLKQAWTGQPFQYRGRPCQVLPVPGTPIPILLGGAAPKVARAAAAMADGFLVPLFSEKVWRPYRKECLNLGKADPGAYPKQGPTLLWVSEDPDAEWEWLAPHILHVLDSYSQWTAEAYGKPMGPYAGGMTAETVRNSGAYQVLTPEDAITLVNTLGDHSSLYLTPLFGGAPPEKGWKMLELFKQLVLPHVPRTRIPRWGHALQANAD